MGFSLVVGDRQIVDSSAVNLRQDGLGSARNPLRLCDFAPLRYLGERATFVSSCLRVCDVRMR
jgi:hypothetical protein